MSRHYGLGMAGFDFMSLMGMLDGLEPETKSHWLDNIDIHAEFELIQQKKSKLSRVRRDAVVRAHTRLAEHARLTQG